MLRPNLPVQLIVDIYRVLPVYISHIRGRHHAELSGDVPVISRKGRVQEAVPYHLGDMIIGSQTRNDFVLLPFRPRIDPNVRDRIQFPRGLEGYHKQIGYEISQHFFFCGIYPVDLGSSLGVLDQPHGVANQVDLGILLTVGTRSGSFRSNLGAGR